MGDFDARTSIADDDDTRKSNFCNLPDFYRNDIVMHRNYLDDSVNESGKLQQTYAMKQASDC